MSHDKGTIQIQPRIVQHMLPPGVKNAVTSLLPAAPGWHWQPAAANHWFLSASPHNGYFVKIQEPGHPFFEKEEKGLALLHRAGMNIPAGVQTGIAAGHQFIIMERVMPGEKTTGFWEKAALQLATLHQHTRPGFGLDEDNYIGPLLQVNTRHNQWVDFFTRCRLLPQIAMAEKHQLLHKQDIALLSLLLKRLPDYFPDEPPSLLHGDLWAGNLLCNEQSNPVWIDPAVYYGHRYMDLAMTALFGGFDPLFYQVYHYHYPLAGNYREHWQVASLYPLLVHINLFGKAYLHQFRAVLQHFS